MADDHMYRDDTGTKIGINDRVRVVHVMNAHTIGREGITVGLGKMDERYGIPNEDNVLYVRLDGETSLYEVYPSRVRIIAKGGNA
jgi:hypothetical protein